MYIQIYNLLFTCICRNYYEFVNGTAVEINRAITLIQNLQERRKHNVPQNKFLKKSPIETIYSSSSMSVSNHKKMLWKDVAIQKINIAKTLDSKNSVELKSDKMVAMRKSTSPNPISDAKQSNSTSKIQLKMSTKVAVNSKRERNFILENKLNIKKVIPPSKPQDHVHDPNYTSAAVCNV